MTVYLILHNEWDFTRVRAIYATKEAAEANLETRTPSGRLSQAVDAHSKSCCEIEEGEVLEA